jgi:hypothetical protein
MIEKLAHAGEGWRAPTPFTISTMTYKVAVKAPAERADKLPLFHLYPYVLCVLHNIRNYSPSHSTQGTPPLE